MYGERVVEILLNSSSRAAECDRLFRMSKKIGLPFFASKLALLLSLFFVQLGAFYLRPFRIVLATSVVFGLYLSTAIPAWYSSSFIIPTLNPAPPPSSFEIQLSSTAQLEKLELKPEVIQSERQHQLQKLEMQPTHRDTLLNLYLLESAAGNQDVAEYYLEKAVEVDPNHPSVKVISQRESNQ